MNAVRVWTYTAIFASAIAVDVSFACQDLVVLSHDGRYLILDGETLAEKAAGNLWQLGIREVHTVVPGSTLKRAGIVTGKDQIPGNGIWLGQGLSLVVVPELGRSIASAEQLAVLSDTSVLRAWWVDSSPDSSLIAVRKVHQEHVISLYDEDLGIRAEWTAGEPDLGLGVACSVGDRIIFGGHRMRFVASGGRFLSSEPFPKTERGYFGQLGIAPYGCIGIMGEFEEPGDLDTSDLTLRTIDLATNTLGPEFRARRSARRILFAGGTRLLQLDMKLTPTGTGGHYQWTTGQLRVHDTRNATVLQSRELETPGDASRLFCHGGNEKVVLQTVYSVRVLDLESLTISAARSIPFERFSVF